MSQQQYSAAEQFFIENPYRIPQEGGHVWKSDIFRIVKLSSYRFRHLVQIICDSDPEFKVRYEPYRKCRLVPLEVAEQAIRKIVDNTSVQIEFYTKGKTVAGKPL